MKLVSEWHEPFHIFVGMNATVGLLAAIGIRWRSNNQVNAFNRILRQFVDGVSMYNPIKNTGMLSSRADVKGNTAAGRQPPRRRRNQNRDGAYASEKSRAAMMSDVTVVPLISAVLRFTPSTTVKVNRMIANAINQDPNEMEISFMSTNRKKEIFHISFHISDFSLFV